MTRKGGDRKGGDRKGIRVPPYKIGTSGRTLGIIVGMNIRDPVGPSALLASYVMVH
jgi:hypothetical protein